MKPRILHITHRVPYPPDRGDRIRTWNVLKFLARHADVDLICLADEPVTQATRDALGQHIRRLAIVPHAGLQRYLQGAVSLVCGSTVTEGLFESRLLSSVVREWSINTHYTAALASSSGIARYVLPPYLKTAAKVWVDLIDVDSQKWFDYARAATPPMSWVYRLEGYRLRKLERRLARETERLLVVTEAECELFREFCPEAPIEAVGNGVDTTFFQPQASERPGHSCVFVGVLDYRPNRDAVIWFADAVWPRIRERYPQAIFRIVGRNPPADVVALNQVPGIEVVGPVPDVRPYLHKSRCVVVPLRIARGVQNKVLEAMASGCAVVCSSAPLKGLQVEPGLQLLQADTPDEWLSEIGQIFDDPYRAEELGLAANAWVQLNHQWEQCLQPLTEMTVTEGAQPESGIEVGP